jgi:hypothetical protein
MTWNSYMMQAEALDYDPNVVSSPDEKGPTNGSRALAIVQAGVYDAVNSIDPLYAPYLQMIPNARGANANAAVAQAAHDTLVAMFPHQQATFDSELSTFLAGIPNSRSKQQGIMVGEQAAMNILAARANDGSQAEQSYTPYPYPGYHQPDPDHPNQGFLSPQWGEVRPFVIDSSNQFRASDMVGTDPASRLAFLNSQTYTDAYNEVMALGSADSTVRTPDQTQIGIFWAYDGQPDIGLPLREFNQVTEVIATQEHNSLVQNARLFALTNLAMADAGIACWETKYYYSFWRPVIGIRNADETGNPNTPEDPNWEPLGAQADNGSGTNFTPPFPSYSSGHATFASALFEVLRSFYATDNISFDFMSDEYNGVTQDANGNVRPVVTRHYDSFSQAEQEVHDSRIYLGVHWRFDQDQGQMTGENVGNWVITHALLPRGRTDSVDGSVVTPPTTDGTGGVVVTPVTPGLTPTDPTVQPQAAVASDTGATAAQPAVASDTGTVATTQPAASPTLEPALGSPDLLGTGLS